MNIGQNIFSDLFLSYYFHEIAIENDSDENFDDITLHQRACKSKFL